MEEVLPAPLRSKLEILDEETGNIAMGTEAAGEDNIVIGRDSGINLSNTCNNNIILGHESGQSLSNSQRNILIGKHTALHSTDPSYKLYVDSTATATPLIGGDFNTRQLILNGKMHFDLDEDPAIVADDLTIASTNMILAGDTVKLAGSALTPYTDDSVATKGYVDNYARGLIVYEPVAYKTTTALTAAYDNGSHGTGATLTIANANITLDGHTLVEGEDEGKRVLVAEQTDEKQNGVYVITQVGSITVDTILTRSDDLNGSPDYEIRVGVYVNVLNGEQFANTGWVLSTRHTLLANPPVISLTDDINEPFTWVMFRGSAVNLGGGLESFQALTYPPADNRFITSTGGDWEATTPDTALSRLSLNTSGALTGIGTVAAPLKLTDGDAAGDILRWSGSAWTTYQMPSIPHDSFDALVGTGQEFTTVQAALTAGRRRIKVVTNTTEALSITLNDNIIIWIASGVVLTTSQLIFATGNGAFSIQIIGENNRTSVLLFTHSNDLISGSGINVSSTRIAQIVVENIWIDHQSTNIISVPSPDPPLLFRRCIFNRENKTTIMQFSYASFQNCVFYKSLAQVGTGANTGLLYFSRCRLESCLDYITGTTTGGTDNTNGVCSIKAQFSSIDDLHIWHQAVGSVKIILANHSILSKVRCYNGGGVTFCLYMTNSIFSDSIDGTNVAFPEIVSASLINNINVSTNSFVIGPTSGTSCTTNVISNIRAGAVWIREAVTNSIITDISANTIYLYCSNCRISNLTTNTDVQFQSSTLMTDNSFNNITTAGALVSVNRSLNNVTFTGLRCATSATVSNESSSAATAPSINVSFVNCIFNSTMSAAAFDQKRHRYWYFTNCIFGATVTVTNGEYIFFDKCYFNSSVTLNGTSGIYNITFDNCTFLFTTNNWTGIINNCRVKNCIGTENIANFSLYANVDPIDPAGNFSAGLLTYTSNRDITVSKNIPKATKTLLLDNNATIRNSYIKVMPDEIIDIPRHYTFGPAESPRWMAVGEGANTLSNSPDGIRWYGMGSSVFTTAGHAVAYNGSLWIAVGEGTNTLAYSADGTTWTGLGTSVFSTRARSVAWNGKRWVATGEGTNTLAYSDNGLHWVGLGTSIFSTVGNDAAWNGSTWIAAGVGTQPGVGNYSVIQDGLKFEFNTYDEAHANWRVQFTNVGSLYVNVQAITSTIIIDYAGFNNTLDIENAWISGGFNWSSGITLTVLNPDMTLSANETINFQPPASQLITLARSSNGITWTAIPDVFSTAGNCVAWNGTRWVAGGAGTYNIAYSSNGINWTTVIGANTAPSNILDVAWNGTNWVIVGNGGAGIDVGNVTAEIGGLRFSFLNPDITSLQWQLYFNPAGYESVSFSGDSAIEINYNEGITTPVNIIGMWDAIGLSIDAGIEVIALDSNPLVGIFGTVDFVSSTGAVPGSGHTIAHSTNGINWTGLGSSIFSTTGKSIYWNGSRFVAVGEGTNTLAHSTNGINWTGLGDATFSTSGNGVAFNNLRPHTIDIPPNVYIATGQGTNTLAYSVDGINWSGLGNTIFSTAGIDAAWNGVMWVAVGEGTNTLAYSFNGINWVGLGTNIFTTAGRAIAWNGSYWIAGGQGVNTLAYSEDGTTWCGLGIEVSSTSGVYAVAWNGAEWRAVGNNIGRSTNGTTWVNSDPGMGGIYYDVIWTGSYWFAARDAANPYPFIYSYGGTSWINTGFSTMFSRAYGVARNESMFVAVGSGSTHTLAWSRDGYTWTGLGKTIFSTEGRSINWNGSWWTATGEGTNSIAYSMDGINWIGLGTDTFITRGYNVSWNANIPKISIQHPVIACGNTQATLSYSPDGIRWTVADNNIFSTAANAAAWNGRRWVAVGSGFTHALAHSLDGINWKGLGKTIFSTEGRAVAWNGTRFIAVGSGTNTRAWSVDGINWTGLGTTILTTAGRGVASNGTMWVAVGTGTNRIVYSNNNGNTWTAATGTLPGSSGNAVAWGANRWVAVGQGTHNIVYSNNGTSWIGLGTTIFSTAGHSVAYNGFRWVAGGFGTNTLAYSDDGITWTGLGTSVFSNACIGITWNGKQWIAVAGKDVAYSPNGINWTVINNLLPASSANGLSTTSTAGAKVSESQITLSDIRYPLSTKLQFTSEAFGNDATDLNINLKTT